VIVTTRRPATQNNLSFRRFLHQQ